MASSTPFKGTTFHRMVPYRRGGNGNGDPFHASASSFSSTLLSSNLSLHSASAFHLSIMSEVWLLNFLRSSVVLNQDESSTFYAFDCICMRSVCTQCCTVLVHTENQGIEDGLQRAALACCLLSKFADPGWRLLATQCHSMTGRLGKAVTRFL